jgi:uncharacterized protein
MTSWTEEALCFDCDGDPLLGIVTRPRAPCRAAVVIVVGGPQYRAGSHRQFVQLARALAAEGLAVLRFDVRGMGDSGGEARDFESLTDDIGSAIDALLRTLPTLERVALWGLCDGASAALLYLHARPDPRVAGVALLNPWVRSPASQARTQVKHYYRDRLRQPEFWHKLVSGKVAAAALGELWRNVRLAARPAPSATASAAPATYQQRMAAAWGAFDGARLLMLSEHDYTAAEFREFVAADATWRRVLAECPAEQHVLAGADHTCSTREAQHAAERITAEWVHRLLGSAA